MVDMPGGNVVAIPGTVDGTIPVTFVSIMPGVVTRPAHHSIYDH